VDHIDKSKIVTGSHQHALVEAALKMRREMTEAESTLWRCLRANRLGGLQFRRQQVIDRSIADFYCHAAGLIVEVDGAVHDGQVARDAERDRAIASRGLRVLRFSNERVVRDTQNVLREILRVAREMIAAQGVPPAAR
jgi:very-short-patch-repair endonuclease